MHTIIWMARPLVIRQCFGRYYQSFFFKIGMEGLQVLIIRHGQINEQLDTILHNTLEDIGRFNGRDIATTALGMGWQKS
jgi:hypothetical protein